jgi:predicted permease
VRTLQTRRWLDDLRQDLSLAVRTLARSPAFTLVALLTLALGIGANVAVFSVVRSVLLRPLPYPAAHELVGVWVDHRSRGRDQPEWFGPLDFADYRDGNRTFSGMAAWGGWGPNLTGTGDPEALAGAAVSWNMLDVLGVPPALGRNFAALDDHAGAERVVILTDGLWRRRFGADPGIIGQAIQLSGEPWTVIGVLPPEFRSQFPWQLLRPLRRPVPEPAGRESFFLRVVGRMKPGVTLEQAHADLSLVADRLAREYPESNAGIKPWLIPYQEQVTGPVRRPLVALQGAVAFVLLLACANLAGLLVVRAGGRLREFGVRAALGAGRPRIVRQLLTESLLLAALGGGLGLGLGWSGARLFGALIPPNVLQLTGIQPDLTVVGFALGLTLGAALLFGLLPALQAGYGSLLSVLRSAHPESGRRVGRVRSGLVVLELAIAVMLLVGAGLLLRSFLALQRTDLGYRTEGLLTMAVALPRQKYPELPAARVAMEAVLERARANPEIRAIEAVDQPPLTVGGDQDLSVYPDGAPIPAGQRAPTLWYRTVTPGYMQLMDMRLAEGRMFTPEDRAGTLPVAIINQEAARRLFPDGRPLGRILATGVDSAADRVTVIGVVQTARPDGPSAPVKSELFLLHSQVTTRFMVLVVEPARDQAAAVTAVRSALREVDGEVPLGAVGTIGQAFADVTAIPRYFAIIVTVFGAAALLLALVGVYGVMAYVVSLRQREIGVRLALGAEPEGIVRWLLGHGARLAVLGLGLGVAAALASTRVIGSLLYGVGTLDVLTFAAVAVLLAGAALAASWLPARRARRVDPIVALRQD